MGMYKKVSSKAQQFKDAVSARLSHISAKTPFEVVLQEHVLRWESKIKELQGKNPDERTGKATAKTNEKIVQIQEIIDATNKFLAKEDRASDHDAFDSLLGKLVAKQEVLKDGETASHLLIQVNLLKERAAILRAVKEAMSGIAAKAEKLDTKVENTALSPADAKLNTAKANLLKELDDKLKKLNHNSVKGVTDSETLITEYKGKIGELGKGSTFNVRAGKTVAMLDTILDTIRQEKNCHPVTKKVMEEAKKDAVIEIQAEEKRNSLVEDEKRPSLSRHGSTDE